MSITQIPRLVRSNLSKGQSAGRGGGNVHMAGGAAKSGGTGGGGVKGGGAKSEGGGTAIGSGFGNENDRDPGGYIGPFAWRGQLTQDAKDARAKHAQFDQDLDSVTTNLNQRLSQGAPLDQALRGVMQDNPKAIHLLMQGGFFKGGLGDFQKAIQQAGGAKKDFTLGPGSTRFSGEDNSVIAQGAKVGQETPPKIIKGPNGELLQQGPGGLAPAQMAGGAPALTKNPNMKDVPPNQISQQDRNFFSQAGNVYNIMASLKNYMGATGPIEGNLRKWAAEHFGTDDVMQGFASLEDRLHSAELNGLLPSRQIGSFREQLKTLPTAGKSTQFNTTLVNGAMEDLRNQTQSRLDQTEFNVTKGGVARIGGQPVQLPDEVLREPNRMDVYGKNQDNKSSTWKLRNAPDQITAKDAEDIINQGETGSNPHILPQDMAKLDKLIGDNAAKQSQRNQGAPQTGNQHPGSAPNQQPAPPPAQPQQIPPGQQMGPGQGAPPQETQAAPNPYVGQTSQAAPSASDEEDE